MTSPIIFLLIWLLAYVLPATAAGYFILFAPLKTKTKAVQAKLNLTIIHIGLFISIALSQYFIHSLGFAFPWALSPAAVLMLTVGIIATIVLMGNLGVIYAASAFIQEATMLLITFLLLQAFPVWLVILLIMPLFAGSHFLSLERWKLRAFLLTLWGIASILIFYVTSSIYLVSALHMVLGALFAKIAMPTWVRAR